MSKSRQVLQGKKKFNFERFAFKTMILLIIAYIITSLVKQEFTIRKYNARIEELESKIDSERKQIEAIKKDMQDADSIETVERIARERLKMIKQGEIMYVDIDEN